MRKKHVLRLDITRLGELLALANVSGICPPKYRKIKCPDNLYCVNCWGVYLGLKMEDGEIKLDNYNGKSWQARTTNR